MSVVNRLPWPIPQLIKTDGTPAASWVLTFYLSGTSTLANVYTAVDLTGPTNALVLSSYGVPSVDIFLDPDVNYKLVVTDDAGTPIFTYNNVRDFARRAVAHFQIYAGNPNGNVAGTAGVVGGTPADAIFDTTNGIIWVCTTTGTAGTAVWTNVSSALSGAVAFTGVLTPASFSTQQDNYNPTDLATASTIRFNPGADSDVTGLAGGTSGRDMVLINTNATYRVTLRNQNTSSSAANRFLLPNGLDVALLPNYVCVINYDSLTGRWRLKSPPFALALGNAQYMSNVAFAFSVGTNALTISLKTARGEDPTPGDPCLVAFRSATITSADYDLVAITAALSLVVSATSSLGFAGSETNLLHIGFINNAGVAELGVSNDGGLWSDKGVVSTTAEGGSGGADSRSVIYSTTARSNVACRLACLATIASGATAGNWSAVPTRATTVAFNPFEPFKNAIKAWVNYTSITTTAIRDAFNFSSLTDAGAGRTVINFAVAMPDANYGYGGSCGRTSGNNDSNQTVDFNTAPAAGALAIATAIAASGELDVAFNSMMVISR
ncbi:MAG: hypothetical protein Q7R41_16605 [Phycisphaerales bacterium]|nr:hypothetical protein [Phycisphaerales bacterium]